MLVAPTTVLYEKHDVYATEPSPPLRYLLCEIRDVLVPTHHRHLDAGCHADAMGRRPSRNPHQQRTLLLLLLAKPPHADCCANMGVTVVVDMPSEAQINRKSYRL